MHGAGDVRIEDVADPSILELTGYRTMADRDSIKVMVTQ
jgi:catabolite regulation protein CreA